MDISAEMWTRVKAVLERAIELEGQARTAYVAQACGEDVALRHRVESLLVSHDRASTFLERPLLQVTGEPDDDLIGRFVSSYRVDGLVGAGGMGEVYRAYDARLDRPVALKLLPSHLAVDAERLQRFQAEARALSALNHPHILVVHELGEHDARPFIVTEFVEGQTLRQRLAGVGPMPTRALLDVAVQTASALAEAHARGVLHRDIKPENVMIRPDGYVKVVDFGIAKLASQDDRATMADWQTRHGIAVGTPQYMSPEQARTDRVDFRSDQFSFGVLLYELATGQSPFRRASIVETAAAVMRDDAEPLDRICPGLPPALRRIIHRCLAKDPDDRYQTTRELHYELVAVRERPIQSAGGRVAPEDRDAIVVMPLKILRGHPDADFLAFALPDAVAATLAERPGISVRSPLAVQRHGGADADFAALAEGMAARFALTGTLACVGERIAVRLQLLEIPAGTIVWSDSRVATLPELFDLQDAVAAEVTKALLSKSVGAPATAVPAARDVPKDPGAYAFYLRANQLAYEVSHWRDARDLYQACVTADPDYAPAWARLARCERLIGKFSDAPDESRLALARAEEGFRRALTLNPDLSIAHSLYAQLMIDVGRADQAMQRLLERARDRPADPDLYTGLVQALRFCGLLDESIAAHARARALDPSVPSSIHHTWWMKGEYARALAETFGDIGYMQGLALASLGREREAIAALRWRERETTERRIRAYLSSLRTALEGDLDKSRAALDMACGLQVDAEALYYLARTFARLGDADRAAQELGRVIAGGFWCYEGFMRDPWLAAVSHRADVRLLLDRAHESVERARDAFVQLGGHQLLDVPASLRT